MKHGLAVARGHLTFYLTVPYVTDMEDSGMNGYIRETSYTYDLIRINETAHSPLATPQWYVVRSTSHPTPACKGTIMSHGVLTSKIVLLLCLSMPPFTLRDITTTSRPRSRTAFFCSEAAVSRQPAAPITAAWRALHHRRGKVYLDDNLTSKKLIEQYYMAFTLTSVCHQRIAA